MKTYVKIIIILLIIVIVGSLILAIYLLKAKNNLFQQEKICTYKAGEILVDAACNQLLIGIEYGYLKVPNEFQDEVLNLIKEYDGKVILRLEDSSYLAIELPNDKQIYEIKDKLEKIKHVTFVGFNQVVVAD